MFSGLDNPIFLSSFDKALVVGSRHAPAPAKLVSKITFSHFIDFADLLSANLHQAWNINLSAGKVVGFKQVLSVGNYGHFDMDQGFYNLSNGDVLNPP